MIGEINSCYYDHVIQCILVASDNTPCMNIAYNNAYTHTHTHIFIIHLYLYIYMQFIIVILIDVLTIIC